MCTSIPGSRGNPIHVSAVSRKTSHISLRFSLGGILHMRLTQTLSFGEKLLCRGCQICLLSALAMVATSRLAKAGECYRSSSSAISSCSGTLCCTTTTFNYKCDAWPDCGGFYALRQLVAAACEVRSNQVPIDFEGTGLSATPALPGLDRDGVIGRSWIGKLDADKENDVLRYIATSCPDCRLE